MEYFYRTYDVKDGAAILKKPKDGSYSTSMEVELLVRKEEEDENIWDNHPRTLEIYANKEGIGFEHEIPGGYSEYTYDPDTTKAFYYTNDLDWFIRSALDQEQRDMLTVNDLTTIRNALDRLQK